MLEILIKKTNVLYEKKLTTENKLPIMHEVIDVVVVFIISFLVVSSILSRYPITIAISIIVGLNIFVFAFIFFAGCYYFMLFYYKLILKDLFTDYLRLYSKYYNYLTMDFFYISVFTHLILYLL